MLTTSYENGLVLGVIFKKSTTLELPKAFAVANSLMYRVELAGRVTTGPEDWVNAPLMMIISFVEAPLEG